MDADHVELDGLFHGPSWQPGFSHHHGFVPSPTIPTTSSEKPSDNAMSLGDE